MASRSLLVIALVALLCAGAVAERQLLKSAGDKSSGKSKGMSKHQYKKLCAKTFPGCAACSGTVDDGDFTCDSCADANAVFDGEACVCDSDEGYGTITKQQYWAWKNANKGGKGGKGGKGKHYGKYAGCVLCSDYDLEAVDGECAAIL